MRETAAELFQLNGDAANTYWRTKARELLADLTEQGRDMNTAREEGLRFFAAVQDEFRKELTHRRSLAIA